MGTAKKWGVSRLTANQRTALVELIHSDTNTSVAWMVKEKLSWIRLAKTPQEARARARGYRTNKHFIMMIYMIASPAGVLLNNG